MPSRLPVVGSDPGAWGAVLNDYLAQAHKPDGTPVLSELAYAQITSSFNLTDTAEVTASAVITAPAFTVDGTTAVIVEFQAMQVSTPTPAANFTIISLFEGATQLARFAAILNPAAAAMTVPVHSRVRLTPTAGAHTYKLTAWASSLTGVPAITAGPGGTGQNSPAYLRVTRA